jgi:hypothetical protein
MKISTVLDHIDSGHMALPEFQRGYVWNRDQVRGLFDSLYRRHPVGGLLVWGTESKTATHRGDGSLAAGIVKLLLDGQQRINFSCPASIRRTFPAAPSFHGTTTRKLLLAFFATLVSGLFAVPELLGVAAAAIAEGQRLLTG